MDVVKSMKIIIADAKSLKEKHFPIEKQTPLFFNKAESLRKQLKELDIDQIHDLMKISFKQSTISCISFSVKMPCFPSIFT